MSRSTRGMASEKPRVVVSLERHAVSITLLLFNFKAIYNIIIS